MRDGQRGKAAAWLVASVAAAASAASAPPTVDARRVPSGQSVRIDGALDESAWEQTSWTGGFVQSVPDFGAEAREATSVAVLFDDHAVYVAVRCDDSAPDMIRTNKLRHRDEPADDHVEIIFDTYRDQIRGTVFVVNPLGAKEEGLVNGYQRYTWSWDEVWDVRAKVTPSGWQAEFRIPLRVLRYGSAERQEWGLNVKRVVRRTQEESYLAPPPPPYDISSLNYATTLAGLELGRRQRNFQVIPYALGGLVRETVADTGDNEERTLSELGVNLKYSITSDLTLDATYNTDFAQVESDDEQVNLTRFSLFYPEKREFFLENADLFSFGHFGGGPQYPDVAPFFSRRIGLYGGATVPIDGGVRLTGKVGREDIGILSARTASVDELGVEDAWYNVARVRHDLGGRSYVGGIVTDSRRGDSHSSTAGLDFMWFLTSDLSLRTDLLRVTDSESDEPADAYNVNLDLTTDPWGFLFGYSQVDEEFAPDLGFVQREGYRNREGLLRYSFRPGRWNVRRVSLRNINNWWDSLEHGVLESSSNVLNCDIELENGDFIELSTGRSFERLFEPFELDEEVVFPPGDYEFVESTIEYHADESRRWGMDAEAGAGEFYDGEQTRLGAEGWVVFNRHLRAEGSYSTVEISTDHGSLEWQLWGLRLSYAHSSTLSASAYGQYNSSTGAKVLNVRLRWILPHDSDLYIVYNERREENGTAPVPRVREVALKVNYRFFV
jgi:hypothetical protein